ncbi:MAG: glycerophosphodiester phosphodiesterase [Burkholderiaceae bacterium]
MAAPFWPGPRRIAHRGGGTLAPENTIAAMRTGFAHGYRAVEFDVMLTGDDVPVLMHDPDFGRTIAGRGRMATTSYADLAKRDAGVWFGPAFAEEGVPRYEDVVAFCVANGVWMNVEIKPSPGAEERTGRIVGELTGRWFPGGSERAGWPLFASFSREALAAARIAAPHVPRGLLFETLPADAIDLASALGCISVHASHRQLDRPVIERLHAAGFAVLAYTVNEVARVEALEVAGIDAIVTDRIDLIAAGRVGSIAGTA